MHSSDIKIEFSWDGKLSASLFQFYKLNSALEREVQQTIEAYPPHPLVTGPQNFYSS